MPAIELTTVVSWFRHGVVLALLVALNWPLYRWFVRVLFGGRRGFGDAVRYWFIPDLWSFIRNRQYEDLWAEIRISVLLVLCLGVLAIEVALHKALLDWWTTNVVCCGDSDHPATLRRR